MTATRAFVVASVLVAGCATRPYQPWFEPLPAMLTPHERFVRVRDVVRERYPRIVVAEATPLRVQSAWTPWRDRDTEGLRRATVFEDGGRLGVVVETRFLVDDAFGTPEWSRTGAAPGLERELGAALHAALFTPGS